MRLSLLLALALALGTGPAGAQDAEETAVPDEETQELTDTPVATLNYAELQSGYRFLSPDGPGAAAVPYGRLKSGVVAGVSAGTLGKEFKLKVDGQFLHDDDYHSDMMLDYAGLVRIGAGSDVLWHNLLRERINPGDLSLMEMDQGQIYGTRTVTTQVNGRINVGNNPIHLNLGYWQLSREGFEQSRFSDHYWEGTGNIVSMARKVDSITREGTVGMDAHLGLLDLSYAFQIRDFSNQAPDLRYNFTNSSAGVIMPGSHAFDVIPDSRVTSNTIKIYSDLSGGLVASAAYSLTQRENNGGHGDAAPSSRPKDLIQSAAGEISYTPSPKYSFSVKYRHREIERDSPASIFYPYLATPGPLQVRPSTDAVRDLVVFSATYRPMTNLNYRLEYSADLESRDNVYDSASSSLRSDSRQTHAGMASVVWRPYEGLRLNAMYRYATCDNPAYGNSFGEQHKGRLLLTYTRTGAWGATASYLAKSESGDSTARKLARTSRTESGNASVWFTPLERLTVTANYSYQKSHTDQTSLMTDIDFTNPAPAFYYSPAAAAYRATAHVYGVDTTYAATEALDLGFSFQQIFSSSHYRTPDSVDFFYNNLNHSYSLAGLGDYSRLDSTETGLAARADWRFTPVVGCGVDYSYRYYRSGDAGYNGSVHATMLTIKARW